MRNIITYSASAVLLTFNIIISHFNPFLGLTCSPYIIGIIALLIGFLSENLNCYKKCLSLTLFIILNDILIRMYSGGIQDSAGSGWISLYILFGALCSYPILIIAIVVDKRSIFHNKFYASLLYLTLIGLYMYLFTNIV